MRIVFDLGSICKREFEQKRRRNMRDFIQEFARTGNSTYSLRREAASFNSEPEPSAERRSAGGSGCLDDHEVKYNGTS